MDRKTACRILSAVPDGQVGILGDFCTDVYWEIHPERGERSIETGLLTTPIAAARYSPGGAGNIDHFIELFHSLPQVDAGLAASIFHFGEVLIPDLKARLREEHILVREVAPC